MNTTTGELNAREWVPMAHFSRVTKYDRSIVIVIISKEERQQE
jgi:hypothetical protein